MGTDAAAVGGKADHQVVQPRVGNEAELAQQRVGLGVEQVDALHQQGPFALAARAAGLASGPCCMSQLPSALVIRRDSTKFSAASLASASNAEQRLEAGDGLADQQGLLVPVVAQELGWRDVAEQG